MGSPVRADTRFDAMGTHARLLIVDEPTGLSHVLRERVLDLEARWSRFVPTSEISRLNSAGGAAVTVSEDTIALIGHAVEGWHATYGLFDPTVLGDLERAGYDRTFDEVGVQAGLAEPTTRSWLVRGCDGIEIDRARGTVRLPAGVGFDPGGIGKGFAADLVAAEAIEAGAAGILVDLGGDLRVRGLPPSGPAAGASASTTRSPIAASVPCSWPTAPSRRAPEPAVGGPPRTVSAATTSSIPCWVGPPTPTCCRPPRWRPTAGRPR